VVSRRKGCTIPPTAPYRCTTHNRHTHPRYQTSVWKRSRCEGGNEGLVSVHSSRIETTVFW